jgi:glycosyltransferase involved in cell wall biosynthesis
VACKNEENNVERLIQSLMRQSYDNFEVILADDGSTDKTADVINRLIEGVSNFHYVYVTADRYADIIGKKRAITAAIEIAKGEIFAFTDADCMPAQGWLDDINTAFAECDFYSGYSPLQFERENCFSCLKNVERGSIFAVSAGGSGVGVPLTCTARNMAYSRKLWDSSEGFKGIGHLLSGDDDLMLHKMCQFAKKYHFSFNKDAIVPSFADNDIKMQINQETRRTSKFTYYPLHIKLFVLNIAIYYCLLMYHFVISFVSLSFKFDLIFALLSKLILEFILLFVFLRKFDRLRYLRHFITAELLYIPYFIFFGLKGTFGKYKWKN